ncbi:hypothetical protein GTQ99_07580 [Kineococcus sp. T13]|uniref:hypothetical protein n=1 Tax=Kineococcus vitellinus TaxID=2696565 RepID=UPI0014128DFB|nr:hypothetical protein [Kineococcus vitellinus]NAZ75284.1 hypothetical protein [Kineococcus vitellinus]
MTDPALLADDLARAALAVPGVARLHGGALGEVGTYLPGRRVAGVRLTGDLAGEAGDALVELHVVVTADAPVRASAQAVHAAAADVLAAHGVSAAVRVHVDDLAA